MCARHWRHQAHTTTKMKLGFSLSPGGLLLPYHLGALHCLQQNNVLGPTSTASMVAGSSAGAIAAMAYGCNIDHFRCLEGTISVAETCQRRHFGTAAGNLLPHLERYMETLVGEEQFEYLQQQQQQSNGAKIGIAFQEVFPQAQGHLQTTFRDRQDLFRAVSYSCMFPFFTSKAPFLVDDVSMLPSSPLSPAGTVRRGQSTARVTKKMPRVLVDGVFSVPWDRFGCPNLGSTAGTKVDRTVAISVLPRHVLEWFQSLKDFAPEDCISPSLSGHDGNQDLTLHLMRMACVPSSRRELTQVFELGYSDAEIWCRQESYRETVRENRQRSYRRRQQQ